jgi:hypothetical protein
MRRGNLTSCSLVIDLISLSADFFSLVSLRSGAWKSKVWSSLSIEVVELPPDIMEEAELVAVPLLGMPIGPTFDSSFEAACGCLVLTAVCYTSDSLK